MVHATGLPMQQKPDVAQVHVPSVRDDALTASDGVHLQCYHNFDSAIDRSKPAIVLFHGRGCTLATLSTLFRLRYFARRHYPVIVYDYRNYGNSDSGDVAQCMEDARACMRFVRAKGYRYEQMVCYGWSHGTGFAAKMAAEFGVHSLLLQFPYTVMREAIRGLKYISDYPLECIDSIPAYGDRVGGSGRKARVMIAVGQNDTLTSLPRSLALLNTLSNNENVDLRFDVYRRCGHMDMPFMQFASDAEHFLQPLNGAADAVASGAGLSVYTRQGKSSAFESVMSVWLIDALRGGVTDETRTRLKHDTETLTAINRIDGLRQQRLLHVAIDRADADHSLQQAAWFGRLLRVIQDSIRGKPSAALMASVMQLLDSPCLLTWYKDSAVQALLRLLVERLRVSSSEKRQAEKFDALVLRIQVSLPMASARVLEVHVEVLRQADLSDEAMCRRLHLHLSPWLRDRELQNPSSYWLQSIDGLLQALCGSDHTHADDSMQQLYVALQRLRQGLIDANPQACARALADMIHLDVRRLLDEVSIDYPDLHELWLAFQHGSLCPHGFDANPLLKDLFDMVVDDARRNNAAAVISQCEFLVYDLLQCSSLTDVQRCQRFAAVVLRRNEHRALQRSIRAYFDEHDIGYALVAMSPLIQQGLALAAAMPVKTKQQQGVRQLVATAMPTIKRYLLESNWRAVAVLVSECLQQLPASDYDDSRRVLLDMLDLCVPEFLRVCRERADASRASSLLLHLTSLIYRQAGKQCADELVCQAAAFIFDEQLPDAVKEMALMGLVAQRNTLNSDEKAKWCRGMAVRQAHAVAHALRCIDGLTTQLRSEQVALTLSPRDRQTVLLLLDVSDALTQRNYAALDRLVEQINQAKVDRVNGLAEKLDVPFSVERLAWLIKQIAVSARPKIQVDKADCVSSGAAAKSP